MWKPIETVPKDGRRFDVWCVPPDSECISHGCRFTDVQYRRDGSGLGFLQHEPDPVWYYLDARYEGPFPEWTPVFWMEKPNSPIVEDTDV